MSSKTPQRHPAGIRAPLITCAAVRHLSWGCHAAESSTKSLRDTFTNLLQESGMDMPEGLTATSESEEDRYNCMTELISDSLTAEQHHV